MTNTKLTIKTIQGKTLAQAQFNPPEYSLSRSAGYSEAKNAGLDEPILQYTKGTSENLTLDLFFDTTKTGMDAKARSVRELTDPFFALAEVPAGKHRPPIVEVFWNSRLMTAVVEKVTQQFTLFNSQGVPLRARLTLTLREFVNLQEQVSGKNKQSPDRAKTYRVRAGDTLTGISLREYDSPKHWKVIADKNAQTITNPRRLRPGDVLRLPRIDPSLPTP